MDLCELQGLWYHRCRSCNPLRFTNSDQIRSLKMRLSNTYQVFHDPRSIIDIPLIQKSDLDIMIHTFCLAYALTRLRILYTSSKQSILICTLAKTQFCEDLEKRQQNFSVNMTREASLVGQSRLYFERQFHRQLEA